MFLPWLTVSSAWRTTPSCMLEPSPTRMGVTSSPLQTAVGATRTIFPMWQLPMTTANGWMNASCSIPGSATSSLKLVSRLGWMFGQTANVASASPEPEDAGPTSSLRSSATCEAISTT